MLNHRLRLVDQIRVDGDDPHGPAGALSTAAAIPEVGGFLNDQIIEALADVYLVDRAVAGYDDAFELLVQRYTGTVYRVALRVIGDLGDAQDITQETFLAAWQNLSRFRHDSAFSTWLYQIVTRRAMNHVTRGRTRPATDLLLDDGATGGWDALGGSRDACLDNPSRCAQPSVDAVIGAVLQLPPAQRVVTVLHHFEGLSYTEIAKITGGSVPAVRSHLFRARRALAHTLQSWGSNQ